MSDSKKTIYTDELENTVKQLTHRNNELENENIKLRQIIKDNDMEEDLGMESFLSDEEMICINEIRKLKLISDSGAFSQEDAKTLDILYKNLRLIRGLDTTKKSKSPKKVSKAEIFKVIEGK